MTTICKFSRSLEPITDWDTDDAPLIDHDIVSVVSTLPDRNEADSHAMQLFVTSLLDHLAAIYEQDVHKREKLIKTMHSMLVTAKILPETRIPEFVSIKQQYRRSFLHFINTAMSLVNQEVSTLGATGNISVLAQSAVERYRPSPATNVSFTNWLKLLSSKFSEEFTSVAKIGKGAFGCVFKAKKKSDGVTYAVKLVTLDSVYNLDWENHETFREVKCLAELSHPNVIRYYDFWVEAKPSVIQIEEPEDSDDEGSSRRQCSVPQSSRGTDNIVFDHSGNKSLNRSTQASSLNGHKLPDHSASQRRRLTPLGPRMVYVLHIQMELCTETLKHWLDKRNQNITKLTESQNGRENRRILKQMLKGIEYVHNKGILHRDIKPLNIFLMHVRGRINVSIGDFGLARHVTPDHLNTGVALDIHAPVHTLPAGDGLTTGRGTDLYSSPEQLNGSDYSSKSDMYSIGMVMYELYSSFTTAMERHCMLRDLRNGKINRNFQIEWPKESSLIESLTEANPALRLTASDVLQGSFFRNKNEIITELRRELGETRESSRQTIEELQQQVSLRDLSIEELRQKGDVKDQLIASLERVLAEQDKEIRKLRRLSQQT